MPNINTLILAGHLTRKPELKHTTSGTAVCKFGIAVNEYSKQQERANFFEVQAWGKVAENCDKYLDKGSAVLIEGNLKQERWESDGQKRSRIIVNAFKVNFLSKPEKKEEKSDNDYSVNEEDYGEEIPF